MNVDSQKIDQYIELKKKFKDFDSIQVCQYNPQLGLIPIEISDIFPAAHHETSRINFDPKEFPTFEKTWASFFNSNRWIVFTPKNAFENLLRLEISATGCVTEINFDIEIFQYSC